MYLYCLFEIYAQRQRVIKTLFARALDFNDEDSIHDLRVEIKRLRAFFNLIEWINPAFQAKQEMSEIRRLFRAAGVLRDNHVQQELVSQWITRRRYELSEYLNELKCAEKDSRPRFVKKGRKFDPGLLTEKWRHIRTALASLPPGHIREKAEGRLRFLTGSLIEFRNKSDFLEGDYHQIRILSKETRYTLEIIRKCFPQDQSRQDLDECIRKMHQALGKWHDDDVALASLDTFLLDYEGEALFRRGDYFKLIQGLEREKQKLLRDFEIAWQAFLKLAAGHGLIGEDTPAKPEQVSVGDNDA